MRRGTARIWRGEVREREFSTEHATEVLVVSTGPRACFESRFTPRRAVDRTTQQPCLIGHRGPAPSAYGYTIAPLSVAAYRWLRNYGQCCGPAGLSLLDLTPLLSC